MSEIFSYSPHTSKKIMDYLLEKDFLSKDDIKDIEKRAVANSSPALKIFLNDNPGLHEKVAKLIAYVTEKPFFAHQENIPLVEYDKKIIDCGAFVINDGGNNKILCLDPLHEALLSFANQNGLKGHPLIVISQITFDYILDNYDKLLEIGNKSKKDHNNIAIG